MKKKSEINGIIEKTHQDTDQKVPIRFKLLKALEASIVVDFEGKLLDCNSKALALFGLTNKEFLNSHVQDILDSTIKESLKTLKSAKNRPEAYFIERFHKNYCNNKNCLEVKGRAFQDDDQDLILLSFRDISSQLKAESELSRLKQLLDMAVEAVFILDVNTRHYIYVNQTALEMYGYTREEFFKLYPSDIEIDLPLKDDADWEKHIEDIRRSKGKLIANGINIKKDKSTFPVEASISYNTLDNEIYLLVMIRDVSLRQKRIAELKKLSRAVEQSPASVVITNTKGDIEYVNPKFTEVTGFSSEEAIGQNPKVLKSGLQGPEIYKEMWDTISAKKEWRGEFHNRKKNGELFWEFASISPVLDDNGDISHYIAVKEDITQRKELEEKLNNSYRKLELLNKNLESRIIAEVGKNREKDQLILHQSRNAQMGELLSMIAHQWRQPLNAISTAMIDLSLKNAMGETSQEKIAELASFVEKTTQKLSRTIDDFMDFYHSDQKKALFHLKSVFDNVLNLMGSQLQASGVTVANNFDENLKLFGCQNMFEQVLINFLANSREAYLNYPADDKTISMTVSENQDEVRLMIEDKAGGIETNIIERIFDPYFTTKEKKSGTGNGLYMSKTIIENNFNGSVLVENTATGAKFTLILPKKQST